MKNMNRIPLNQISNQVTFWTKSIAVVAVLTTGIQVVTAQPAHLVNGIELVEQIIETQSGGIFVDENNIEINRYGGSWNSNSNPSYIQLGDPDQDILPGNNTKCAPFVTHLLKETYNWNWRDYNFFDPIKNKVVKSSSPSSYRYVALIEQEIGFEEQIHTLDEVQPGDIMAIHYLGGSSGHTTMVADVNWQSIKAYPSYHNNALPEFDGTFYVEVTVVDSSSGTHTNDSRFVTFDNNVIETHGLGIGTMGVLIDEDFTWSLPNSDYDTLTGGWLNGLHSRLKLQSERKMVFGRLPVMP